MPNEALGTWFAGWPTFIAFAAPLVAFVMVTLLRPAASEAEPARKGT